MGGALPEMAEASQERSTRSALSCRDIFNLIEGSLPKFGFTDSYAESRLVSEATVNLEKTLKDSSGESFLVFARTGSSWGSGASTVGYDVQGDPRWFFEVLGADLSPTLGFWWDLDKRLQLPTPETWNRRIKMLSDQLVSKGFEPIPVHFDFDFHAKEEAFAELDRRSLYSETMIYRKTIPMALEGIPILHDMSFHTGAILFEEKILNFAASRFEYLYKAYLHLNERAQGLPNNFNKKKILSLIHDIRMHVVEGIDSGMGLVNPGISAAHLKTKQSLKFPFKLDERSMAHDVYVHLLGTPSMPVARQFREFLSSKADQKNYLFSKEVNEWIESSIADFENGFVSSFAGYDPYVAIDLNIEELCQSLMRRRQELREAARDLLPLVARPPLQVEIENEKPPSRSLLHRLLFRR